MKLKTEDVPVKISGAQEQGEFRIKNSATAFAILSSGLYSNKFKAILRELGCNAYDSHVEAGFPEKPFTVHLPTRINPILSVKDYGVGLNHDQVMNLYTTYFESTKNDSNDFVGCMGLGSKSPFSYTKNFTITAIKDGWKGIYSAFIGDQGVPNIVQLTSADTDEGNGVEVSFAVESIGDMNQFKHEVADTFKWFKTHPEITGNEVTIPEIKYTEEDIIAGASLVESHNSYNAKSYAIMGNVAYPINIPNGEDISDQIRNLYNNNSFIVRFEIGELDIAASREELGYVPHTIESLKNKAEEIMLALEVYVDDKLKPAKTKWERHILATNLLKSNQELFNEIISRYIKKNPRKFIKYITKKYHTVPFNLPLQEIETQEGLRITYKSVRNYHGYNPVSLANIKTVSVKKPKKLQSKKFDRHDSMNNWYVYQIDPKTTTIVFNNEGGNILQRIRLAILDTDYKDLISTTQILVCAPQNKKVDQKKLLKYIKIRLGNPKIVFASDLPNTVKGNGTTAGNQSITVSKFIDRRISRYVRDYTFNTVLSKMKDLEPTIEKNNKKIFLYVKLSYKGIIKPYTDIDSPLWNASTIWEYIECYNLAKMAGIDMNKVYGVNKTSLKTVTADNQWVNLFDYFQKQFKNINWGDARAETIRKLIKSEFADGSFDPQNIDMALFKKIAKTNTPAGKLFAAWIAYKNLATGVKTSVQYDRVILGMTQLFPKTDFSKSEAKLNVNTISIKYEKLFERFNTKYPMLTHLSLNSNYFNERRDWKDALQYIKLVDSAKK